MNNFEPISVYVPGDPTDPRLTRDLPEGIEAHYGPALHPDDLDVVRGIPCTSVSRTLIDLAEVVDKQELRECFARAHKQGLLDLDKLAASRARVEWRPSLAMLDEVIAEWHG